MTITAPASAVTAHFNRSVAATEEFFDREASRVAACCREMAARFSAGGTLYVVGEGAQASDAHHVAVEFVHPVIVGKRALPAVALTSDVAAFTAATRRGSGDGFALPLETLARPGDMLLVIADASPAPALGRAVDAARAKGLMTIVASGAPMAWRDTDVNFAVSAADAFVVQEIGETLYHILWELVHVFLDAGDAHLTAFLPADAPASESHLLDQVIASTRHKAGDVVNLRQAVLHRWHAEIAAAGAALAARAARRGRVFALGNGGSATDAQDAAVDCVVPPIAGWRAIPAIALTNDIGVITAIANDVGFERVFARQLAAFAGPNDVALVFSTSGASRNVLAAVVEARARKLLTIAMSSGDGGTLGRTAEVDFCFTVPSDYLPRIQEVHATIWHALLAAAQEALP